MLRFVEGFECYSNVNQVAERWNAVIGTSSFSSGRAGWGQAFYFQGVLGENTSILSTGVLVNESTWFVGFAFQNGIGSGSYCVLDVRDSSTSQVQLWFNATTNVFFVQNGSGTILGTGSALINNGVWFYIEFSVTIGSSGSFTTKVNGTTDISGTGVTQISVNSTANTFAFLKPASWYTGYILDDIYILDSTGSINNTYLGEIKTEAIVANGAGSSTQWTPVPGTLANYQAVNGSTAGSYVETSTASNVDLYTFSSLQHITGSIAGVSVVIAGQCSNTNSHGMQSVVKSSGTTVDSSTQTYNSISPAFKGFIQETDPNTSSAWTASGVNAAQYGIKLIS